MRRIRDKDYRHAPPHGDMYLGHRIGLPEQLCNRSGSGRGRHLGPIPDIRSHQANVGEVGRRLDLDRSLRVMPKCDTSPSRAVAILPVSMGAQPPFRQPGLRFLPVATPCCAVSEIRRNDQDAVCGTFPRISLSDAPSRKVARQGSIPAPPCRADAQQWEVLRIAPDARVVFGVQNVRFKSRMLDFVRFLV